MVAAVVPWNFPLLIASWKIGPALAAGNSVILKPAEQSPLTAIRIAELAAQAGVPEGILNVVPGLGETAGQALGRHMDVDSVSFTGSTEVGKLFLKYAAESNMKQVSLECGGKSPHIVMADAPDLDTVAKSAAFGIYFNQGEVCNAGSRLLVHESIRDELVEKVMCVRPAHAAGQPARSQDDDGGNGGRRADRSRDGLHRYRQDRGGRAQDGRSARARGQWRLLYRANPVRQGRQLHDDRSGRDIRAGACHPRLQGRGRGGAYWQRYDIRTGGRGVDTRYLDGASRGAPGFAPARCG